MNDHPDLRVVLYVPAQDGGGGGMVAMLGGAMPDAWPAAYTGAQPLVMFAPQFQDDNMIARGQS